MRQDAVTNPSTPEPPKRIKPRKHLRQSSVYDCPNIRQPETSAVTGYHDDTLRRKEREGTFPPRFKLDPRAGEQGAVAWDRAEVMAWVAQRRVSRQTT